MIIKKISKGPKATALPKAGPRPNYYKSVVSSESTRRESNDDSLTDTMLGVGVGIAISSIFDSNDSLSSNSDSSSSFDFGGGDFGGGGSGGDY